MPEVPNDKKQSVQLSEVEQGGEQQQPSGDENKTEETTKKETALDEKDAADAEAHANRERPEGHGAGATTQPQQQEAVAGHGAATSVISATDSRVAGEETPSETKNVNAPSVVKTTETTTPVTESAKPVTESSAYSISRRSRERREGADEETNLPMRRVIRRGGTNDEGEARGVVPTRRITRRIGKLVDEEAPTRSPR